MQNAKIFQKMQVHFTCKEVSQKCRIMQMHESGHSSRVVYQEIYTNINAAKFSQKWVDGFMTRHNLVNRRKTTVAQRLPDDYVELQNNFLFYILYQRKEN